MSAKTMAEARDGLVDRIALFLATNYPCDCGADSSCSEEPEADAIVELMEAAGFGLVADAKAEALEEAAASIASGGSISRWLRARANAVRGEG